MSDVNSVAVHATIEGARAMEARIQAAFALAGVTVEDFLSGRADAESRTLYRCPNCWGHGIASRIGWTSKAVLVVTVELCSCLEIRVTKRL